MDLKSNPAIPQLDLNLPSEGQSEVSKSFYEDCKNPRFTQKDTIKYMPSYYTRCIPVAFNRMMPVFSNLVSLHYVSWYEEAVLSAGYGLGQSIFTFFFQVIMIIHSEAFGVLATEAFGSKDIKKLRLTCCRGLFIKILVILQNIVWFYNVGTVLEMLNFDKRQSDVAQKMAISLIPSMFVASQNSLLQTYLISMKITNLMTYMNLFQFFLQIPLGYLCIWKSGLALVGYGVMRFTTEVLTQISLYYIAKKFADPETLEFQKETLKDVFELKEVRYYLGLFFPVFQGWYSSFLGVEGMIILTGIYNDVELQASYVISFQVAMCSFTCGAGMANITRTDVIIAIQEGKLISARKYAWMGLFNKCIFSFINGLFVMYFSSYISQLFSVVPGVLVYLDYMVPLCGLQIWVNTTFATIATVQRSIKKSNQLACIYVVTSILIMDGIGIYVLFFSDGFKGRIIWGFIVSRFISIIWGVGQMQRFDWEGLKSSQN